MIHVQEGTERTVQDFVTVLRTAHNLRLIVYFWNFLCNIFGLQFTMGNCNWRSLTLKSTLLLQVTKEQKQISPMGIAETDKTKEK